MSAGGPIPPTAGDGVPPRGEAAPRPNRFTFHRGGPFGRRAPCSIARDGRRFTSAERARAVETARLSGDAASAAAILSPDGPGRQKALGRRIAGFSDALRDERGPRGGPARQPRRVLAGQGAAAKAVPDRPDAPGGGEPARRDPGRIGLDGATARMTDPRDWPGQNPLGHTPTEVRDELARAHPKEAAACAP